MSKLSITRALAEIKSLEDRILKGVSAAPFIAVAQGRGDKQTAVGFSVPVTKVAEAITGNYQATAAMMEHRGKLKAAVIKSNAATQVTIGSETMSVAEAIEKKNAIKQDEALLSALKAQRQRVIGQVEQGNTKLLADIDSAVAQAYNGERNKPTQEMYDAIANPRKDSRELSLIDPCKIDDKIEALVKRIDDFKLNVDFALSEVNAKTEIEVE